MPRTAVSNIPITAKAKSCRVSDRIVEWHSMPGRHLHLRQAAKFPAMKAPANGTYCENI